MHWCEVNQEDFVFGLARTRSSGVGAVLVQRRPRELLVSERRES